MAGHRPGTGRRRVGEGKKGRVLPRAGLPHCPTQVCRRSWEWVRCHQQAAGEASGSWPTRLPPADCSPSDPQKSLPAAATYPDWTVVLALSPANGQQRVYIIQMGSVGRTRQETLGTS